MEIDNDLFNFEIYLIETFNVKLKYKSNKSKVISSSLDYQS